MKKNLTVASGILSILLVLIDLASAVLSATPSTFRLVMVLVVLEAAVAGLFDLFEHMASIDIPEKSQTYRILTAVGGFVLAVSVLLGLLHSVFRLYTIFLQSVSTSTKLQPIWTMLNTLPISLDMLGGLLLTVYGMFCLSGTYHIAIRFIRIAIIPATLFFVQMIIGCCSGLKSVFVRWKTLVRELATYAILLVVAATCGTALLVAVYAIPVERTYPNAVSSAAAMGNEGRYFQVVHDSNATWVNNLTVSRWLNAAAYYDDEMSVFQNAMQLPRATYGDDSSENTFSDFIRYTSGDDGFSTLTYSHYWQGCQIFVRPLLSISSIWGIRILNMFLQIAFLIAISILMKQRGLRRYIAPYILSALAITACFVLPLSIDFCAVYYIASITILSILCPASTPSNRQSRLVLLFSGIATAYFDTLTNPLLTVGIPLLFLLLRDYTCGAPQAKKREYFFKRVLLVCLAWLIGYAGMWVMKWIVGSFAAGTNLLVDSWNQILYRTSTSFGEINFTRSDVIFLNFNTMFFNNVFALPTYVWVTFKFVRLHAPLPNKIPSDSQKNWIAMVLLITLLPLIWYLFVSNHSYIHYWFTYREWMLSLLGLLFLLANHDPANGMIPAHKNLVEQEK